MALNANRKHCRLCGMTVCAYCSNNKKQLSRKDKSLYRVCDYCDVKVSNQGFEKMYAEIIQERDGELSDIKDLLRQKNAIMIDTEKKIEALENVEAMKKIEK